MVSEEAAFERLHWKCNDDKVLEGPDIDAYGKPNQPSVRRIPFFQRVCMDGIIDITALDPLQS